MKKLLSIMLAAFMVMGMFSVVALADADITITNADELIAWATNGSDDAGKTVVLAEDVTLTGTWTAKENFAGTFDGQGHKISGINGAQGLIARTSAEATIKSLSIVDSTITTTEYNAAAFVGKAAANVHFIDCYTNAKVSGNKNNYAGFLGDGTSGAGSTFTFKGCWFDGQIDGTGTTDSMGRYVSGFLANNESNNATFEDCLSTGSVSAMCTNAIPIVSFVAGAGYQGHMEFTNVLVNGGTITVDSTFGAQAGGAIAFRSQKNDDVFANCYATEGIANFLSHETNANSKAGQVEWIKAEDITVDKMGAAWGESTDGKVVPAAFAAPFEGAEISSWDELVAWAADEKNVGEDARLIADITAPADATWTPKPSYSGKFDGMGHTISGLKANIEGGAFIGSTIGATIKNVYFVGCEFTSPKGNVANIAVYSAGSTFENIYSDAVVTATAPSAGGLIVHGTSNSTLADQTNTFISCWFDGVLNLGEGQYGSGIFGNQESQPAVFTDCLNTGKITGKTNVAGISTAVYDGSAVCTRCVNLGEVMNTEGKLMEGIIRTVTHRNDTAVGTAELVDCYNLKDKAASQPSDVRSGATLTGSVTEVPSLEDLSVFSGLKGYWKVTTYSDNAGGAYDIVVPNYFAKDGADIPEPAPSTAAPTTAAPSTAAPTAAPTTAAPTAAPTTAAPTAAPTTAAPTEAPATEAPTTAAPTEAPATAAPTEAPASATASQAPASQAPVTADGVTVFMIVALVLSAGAFVVVSKARARV